MQPLPEPNGSLLITKRDTTVRQALVDLHIFREVHRDDGWLTRDLRFGLHMGSLGFVSALLRLPSHPGLSLEPYFATDLGRHHSFSLKLNYRINR